MINLTLGMPKFGQYKSRLSGKVFPSSRAIAPTATNDTGTTNQASAIALNVLANDSDTIDLITSL